MKIKSIEDENFVNYKLPSMTIGCYMCDLKCCHEANIPESTCINYNILQQPIYNISPKEIYTRYKNNNITQAIIFAGLEPILQFDEIIEVIDYIRKNDTISPIIIYTGYYPNEIQNELNQLKKYSNIIVKFGRYIPNRTSRYDDILGITLISDNQYAERIS
jgi:pyruvate-formate lyase-activating enzyme